MSSLFAALALLPRPLVAPLTFALDALARACPLSLFATMPLAIAALPLLVARAHACSLVMSGGGACRRVGVGFERASACPP